MDSISQFRTLEELVSCLNKEKKLLRDVFGDRKTHIYSMDLALELVEHQRERIQYLIDYGVDGLLFSDVKHSFIVTFIGCFLWIMLHMKTYGQLKRLEGKQLNKVLGATARNIFLFAIAFALMAIVVSCCG